jgi:hypothetical protein
VSTAIWNRLVAGLNAQLRTVRQGNIRSTLGPVVSWINSHGNPQLERHGVRVELGWFQATASCYYQLGIVVAVNEHFYKSLHQHDHVSEFIDRSRYGNNYQSQYHILLILLLLCKIVVSLLILQEEHQFQEAKSRSALHKLCCF